MKKEIIYVDMDNTICDFSTPYRKGRINGVRHPQSKEGFFLDLAPIEDCIEVIGKLNEKYDVWFLTKPSIKNFHSYIEKAKWIERYFGMQLGLKRLIMSCDKSLLKGEFLIDDYTNCNQEKFEGEFIRYGVDIMSWKEIEEKFL